MFVVSTLLRATGPNVRFRVRAIAGSLADLQIGVSTEFKCYPSSDLEVPGDLRALSSRQGEVDGQDVGVVGKRARGKVLDTTRDVLEAGAGGDDRDTGGPHGTGVAVVAREPYWSDCPVRARGSGSPYVTWRPYRPVIPVYSPTGGTDSAIRPGSAGSTRGSHVARGPR